jgi:hypothetical protein
VLRFCAGLSCAEATLEMASVNIVVAMMLANLPWSPMRVSAEFRLGVALSVVQALAVATVVQGVTLSGLVLKVNGMEVTSGVPEETSCKLSVIGELKRVSGVARAAFPGG